ncbi:glycosyl transferase [Phlyctochytrium arcticum]|nr:glycosyl transferase [Phlyctochytrium arcticum]
MARYSQHGLKTSAPAAQLQPPTSQMRAEDTAYKQAAVAILVFSTISKALLSYSYRSTDFEVHRNWLAITFSLPIEEWYYEKTSEWTLDYPPFFAWFEYLLAHVAKYIDPRMLQVNNLGYASDRTILFQRASVIGTELLYFAACYRFVKYFGKPQSQRAKLLALLFLSPCLILVDSIHFQYNGFMYGIQLLSIVAIFQGRPVLGALLFAALLNFKHVYLYIAPAYFVYLLSGYCFLPNGRFAPTHFLTLGLIVITTFAASLLPFAHHLPQLLTRLFPFSRGLTHAYWAPNFWALYAFLDRVLIAALRVSGKLPGSAVGMTRGIVGDTSFVVLPEVQPGHALILTVISQLPVLWKLWRAPTPSNFVTALVFSSYSSFLFGWHVHEKAILMVLIPLALCVQRSETWAREWFVISSAAVVSLFPLLFKPAEVVAKFAIAGLWSTLAYHTLASFYGKSRLELPILKRLYLFILPLLALVAEAMPFLAPNEKYEFLPLMAISVYTSVGIIWGWLELYQIALFGGDGTDRAPKTQ